MTEKKKFFSGISFDMSKTEPLHLESYSSKSIESVGSYNSLNVKTSRQNVNRLLQRNRQKFASVGIRSVVDIQTALREELSYLGYSLTDYNGKDILSLDGKFGGFSLGAIQAYAREKLLGTGKYDLTESQITNLSYDDLGYIILVLGNNYSAKQQVMREYPELYAQQETAIGTLDDSKRIDIDGAIEGYRQEANNHLDNINTEHRQFVLNFDVNNATAFDIRKLQGIIAKHYNLKGFVDGAYGPNTTTYHNMLKQELNKINYSDRRGINTYNLEYHLDDSITTYRTIEYSNIGIAKVLFGNQITDVKLRDKYIENINIESIGSILEDDRTSSILYQNVSRWWKENKGNKSGYWYGNTGDFEKIFENVGYIPKGGWDMFAGEQMSLLSLILTVGETQDKIPTSTWKDKAGLMFDFDSSTILDDNPHFYIRELQPFKTITSEKQFVNLVENIGYPGGYNQFNIDMNSNYYGTRVGFKRMMGTILASGILKDPSDLLKPNAISQSVKNNMRSIDFIESGVSNTLQSNPKYRSMEKDLTDEQIQQIKGYGVGLAIGEVQGFGISKDVSQITNNMLNNASISYANGGFALNLGKNISDRISAGASVSLDGGVSGGVSIALTDKQLPKFQNLFPITFSGTPQIGVGAGVSSLGGIGVGGYVTRFDQNIESARQSAIEQMKGIIDGIFDYVVTNKGRASFQSYAAANGIEINQRNQKIYNEIVGMCSSASWNKQVIDKIKIGMLNNYKTTLHTNVDGFNFTGVGFGMMGPILGIGFSGEINNTERKQVYEAHPNKMTSFSIDLESYTQEAFEHAEAINSSISPLLNASQDKNKDALTSPNTPGMVDLQVMVHDYLNERRNLDSTWTQARKVFFSKEIEQYAKDTGKTANLLAVRDLLNKTSNPAVKHMVLQNIAGNLMKKWWITVHENGVVELAPGKTVKSSMNLKRRSFFNGVFKKSFPDLPIEALERARDTYEGRHGDETSFRVGVLQPSDGVAYSGVQVGGRTKRYGTNPGIGGSHIAIFDDGHPSKIEMKGVKSDSAIDDIPSGTLQVMAKQLREKGITINTLEDVKELIKSGGKNGVRVSYKLWYAKDPECLNDKIIVDPQVDGKSVQPSWDLFMPEHSTVNVGVMYTYNTEEDPKKTEEDPKKTEEDPKKTEEDPKKTEEDPKKTEENPKKTEENPKKTEEDPNKNKQETVPGEIGTSEENTHEEVTFESQPDATATVDVSKETQLIDNNKIAGEVLKGDVPNGKVVDGSKINSQPKPPVAAKNNNYRPNGGQGPTNTNNTATDNENGMVTLP